MNNPPFEPVSDPELFRSAVKMLAIGNVAVHRAQALNRSLGIANHYSIGGRIVSDRDRDDGGSAVAEKAEDHTAS